MEFNKQIILGVSFICLSLSFCNRNHGQHVLDAERTDLIGDWKGYSIQLRQGSGGNDTFFTHLNITNNTDYSMVRSLTTPSDWPESYDTLSESGKWVLTTNLDSVLFQPDTEKCKKYTIGVGIMEHSSCTTPVKLKLNISGSTWTVDVPKFTDASTKFPTVLTKN